MNYFLFFLIVITTPFLSIAQPASESLLISKQTAIKTALKKGYYKYDSTWFEPVVVLDTLKQQWVITSSKLTQVKRGKCYLKKANPSENCNCKNTNGCTDRTTKQIIINALNGFIIEKSIKKERFPNYE